MYKEMWADFGDRKRTGFVDHNVLILVENKSPIKNGQGFSKMFSTSSNCESGCLCPMGSPHLPPRVKLLVWMHISELVALKGNHFQLRWFYRQARRNTRILMIELEHVLNALWDQCRQFSWLLLDNIDNLVDPPQQGPWWMSFLDSQALQLLTSWHHEVLWVSLPPS